MGLAWGPLPPLRRGLLTSPLREWQARRALLHGWHARYGPGAGPLPPCLCPTADDIWLYFMARLAGTQFRHTGWTDPLVTWGGSQLSALWRANVADHGNDRGLAAMFARFGTDVVSDAQADRVLAA